MKTIMKQSGAARTRLTMLGVLLGSMMYGLGGAGRQAELRPVDAHEHAPAPTWPVPAAASLPAYPTKGALAEGPARVLSVERVSTAVIMLDGVETRVRLMGVGEPQKAGTADRPGEETTVGATDVLTAQLGDMLVGEDVWIERHRGSSSGGAVRTDRDGSPFVYMYRVPDGLMVNLEIVRRGIAPADVRYGFEALPIFRAYHEHARSLKRGMWAELKREPVAEKPVPSPPKSKPSEDAPKDGAQPKEVAPKEPSGDAQKEMAKEPAAAKSTDVYATPSGSKYHRPDCRYAKDGKPMTRDEAKKKGLSPCKLCKPDDETKSTE